MLTSNMQEEYGRPSFNILMVRMIFIKALMSTIQKKNLKY